MGMRKGLPAKLALTDADDTRWDFRNLVALNADGTPRQGITGPVGTNLVTGSATMNVSVGAFSAVAKRDNGVVLLANDGPTNVLIGAAPVSNSRIDLICARQNDASSTVSVPDANNTPVLYAIAGAAAPIPTAPALPDGSVEVGRVTVTAGNTNTNAMTITQASQYTAGVGAPVPFRTYSALQDWTTAQQQQHATVFADTVNNGDYVRIGNAWIASAPPVPLCRVTVTTGGIASSATPGQFLSMPWNVETFDTAGMHDNTFSSRISAPIAGYYRAKAKVRFTSGTTGAAQFTVSGVAASETQTYVQFASGAFADVGLDSLLFLNAGQYVEVQIGSTSASASVSAPGCYFELELVRYA